MSYNANISNLSRYNAEMRKSMMDKLFFLDKLDNQPRTIVDFGCANGDMINFMTELAPEHSYVGYDVNEIELALARKNAPQAQYFSDWEKLIEEVNTREAVLVLSSVIHEVWSYGTSAEIQEFWDRIRFAEFKYIVIREMCPDLEYSPSFQDIAAVASQTSDDKLASWDVRWGELEYKTSFVHYLLTYRYDQTPEQWQRELNENYFPYTKEEYLNKFPGYKLDYIQHYTLPFIAKQVKEDFGINLTAKTHIKLIFERC